MAAFVDLDALQAIVQTNAGPLVAVSWGNTPNPMPVASGLDGNGIPLAGMPAAPPAIDPAHSGGAVAITLDLAPITQVGWDDTRRTFDPTANGGAGAIAIVQTGIRHFTLTMRVESDLYPAALTVCERMRTRWLRKSTLAALKAIGCALREVSDTRSMQVAYWDQKTIDVASLDVHLTYGMTEADPIGDQPAGDPVGNWIQTVGFDTKSTPKP